MDSSGWLLSIRYKLLKRRGSRKMITCHCDERSEEAIWFSAAAISDSRSKKLVALRGPRKMIACHCDERSEEAIWFSVAAISDSRSKKLVALRGPRKMISRHCERFLRSNLFFDQRMKEWFILIPSNKTFHSNGSLS